MTHTHSQVASPETANVPARDQGALLMIASPEILKRLSALSRHAGHVATVWHGERGPPDSAALLGNRIIFIEVRPNWTGAIETLCHLKDQSFSGFVVLVGGDDATTLERVHTVIDAAWPVRGSRPPITVEISEDEAIGDVQLAQAAAQRLRGHGVQLSIDDFGNGLAGFARLRDLPCCEVKLDRGFVTGCSTSPRLQALCAATVSLARQFDVRATAEGVETAEDCAEVERQGFDRAQGYFFAKPMPFVDFHRELKRRNRGRRPQGARARPSAGGIQAASQGLAGPTS